MIPSEKRTRHDNEENQDRLSDLPDCVLLHILSSLNSKLAVQTCILSTRWKHLWKNIHNLILHSTDFRESIDFAVFVSNILTLRDTSIGLQALDLDNRGDIEPRLLNIVLNYVCSHNTHIEQLGITVTADICPVLSCVSKCRTLTSLKLSVYPRGGDNYAETLFPKSLNLPLLTSLDLTHFTFCGDENGCAEPFSAFTKLNSLVLRFYKVKDAEILRISSVTLVSLALHCHDSSSDFPKIELSTPSLSTFTFPRNLDQKIGGTALSSVKQVNINIPDFAVSAVRALDILSWLQDLVNVESLTVTSITLQILSLAPDLFNVKLSSLYNLKSLEVELIPLDYGGLSRLMEKTLLNKAAAKSRKEASKLRKEFKAGFKPPPIPDGIVDFLRQNSPSAEVNIKTYYPNHFDLKQVEESIKGGKNTSYHSQFASPAFSSAVSASSAAPSSAAPPNLHLCRAEKTHDKASQFQKKRCDHHKLLEIKCNKNNETGAHHSSIQDQPNTNIGNEFNNLYLNTKGANNARVDNYSSDNYIQEVECIIRRGKQKIQVKDHTSKKESTSHQMRDAPVARAQARGKIVEASSSQVTEDCSLLKCMVALEEIRDISNDIFGKALEKFKDPDWRKMFIAMSNDKRRAWLLRL
ncbi:F-box/LRR-repeat protein 13-like [Trifolium pratense]|uniref:F-box/LRR-repeat protein 13-like n=1 Tax=Trifolium pratense TaxID=57577 RepID=UPI001E6940A5|nr:F-box/LRR-repeat protein 13-like [Trifolium pratense]XP_045826067.1 F-box/LRR-repeat protein 13-like [Trifolium pratense]